MSLLGDLATLSKRAGFTKLLGVRLVSQVGDGMFQAGLASLFFFSPQSMAGPGGVASALVVLLLPYSLIGPFTGPFLDRWRRRQVLFYGNLVRCALVAVIAAVMALLGVGPAVGALALCTLGLARFLLSALSAGLPKVVGGNERLVMANSVVPTLGGIAMGLGAVIGLLMRVLLPESASREISSLVAAALLYLGAALAALLLAPDELGPDGVERPAPLGETLRRTAGELGAAVTYLLSRGTPAAALVTMALHRFVYYMELITIILAARNLLSEPSDADAGIALFGTLGGAMVAGHFLAVILTPVAHERMAPSRWTLVCLVVGTVGQLAVAVSYSTPVFIAGLFVFGIGVQGAKIAVDSIIQGDVEDAYRGRTFAIYDVMFNMSACIAAAVALLVLPDVGWSRTVQAGLAAFVWATAFGYWRSVRALGDEPRRAGPTAAG